MRELDDVAAQIDAMTLTARPARGPLVPGRFARIVAALDGSDASLHVVAWAAALARAGDGRVEAVVVGPPRSPYESLAKRGSEWTVVAEAWHQEAAEAEKAAADALKAMAKQRVVGSAKVLAGHPVAEIVGYARQCAADVVVLGSHGDGPVSRLVLGSVAEGVKDRAEQSVLIARGAAPPRRILVATDGSPHSRRAVGQALQLARAWKAELTVLHAHDLPRMGSSHDAEAAVRALLADMQDVTRGGIRYRLVVGKPAAAILAEQEGTGAGLIVVGRRGVGPLRGRLLGSVSSAVARRAPCAVLVVA